MEQSRQTIKDVCLRLLARREHSQKELLTKLKQRGLDIEQAKIVIDELAQENWQSNDRFSESFARQRIRKGYGPVRICYELQQKGAAALDLDKLLDDMAMTWLDVIEQVYLNKYPQSTSITLADWSKRYRFLQQRGFSADLIKQLSQHLKIKIER